MLLIDAALAQGRLDLVWEQILSLREGGQDIAVLQVQLDAWMVDNDPDPGQDRSSGDSGQYPRCSQ